jgi:MerR family transcriptional regulator, light-induced transcriptional regulator
MAENAKGMNVKAVARALGISPHTLRAWERRYAIVTPERSETGRRLYTEKQVERLKTIVSLIEVGHGIGQLAALNEKDLKKIARTTAPVPTRNIGTHAETSLRVERIVRALGKYELENVARELDRARLSVSCREFVLFVVLPLMKEVGTLVGDNRFSIAQEHALSAIMRHQVGLILQTAQTRQDSESESVKILMTSAEGDVHEFGILVAAVLAAHHGLECQYLGVSLPKQALVEAAKALKPNLLLLSNTPLPDTKRGEFMENYLRFLDRHLDEGVEIWVGGAGALATKPNSSWKRGFKQIQSIPQLDTMLGAFAR